MLMGLWDWFFGIFSWSIGSFLSICLSFLIVGVGQCVEVSTLGS